MSLCILLPEKKLVLAENQEELNELLKKIEDVSKTHYTNKKKNKKTKLK
jgi:hypothetical protein